MMEKILDVIDNFMEDLKDKEYVCYYRSMVGYQKNYFTKEQLIKFINQNQLSDIEIYKIKDRIKLERELRIYEKEE